MNTNIKFAILLGVSGLIAATAFFFFPEVKAADIELALAIAFASTLTQLAAVWYFLTSLRTFKKELQIAYYLLSAGIFLFSWTQLLPSLTVFVELTTNATVSNLLFVTPYALGAFLMYLGMRKFARLLDIHFVWNSFWLVLGLSIISLISFAMLFHAKYPEYGRTLELIFGTVTWCGVFSAAAMAVALRIRQTIGTVYKSAMTWTAAALGVLSFTTFHEVIVKTYFLDSWYAVHSMSLWPYLIAGVLLLRAGLAFKETGRQYISLPENATYVDVAVGAAQLVSNMSAVDDKLDNIRIITAKRGKEQLSAEDKATLVRVYLYVENYLVTEEPLQKFTREGLRNALPDDFVRALPA